MLELLHRDERFVVVNKPGGLLVHRTRQSADKVVLLQLLRDQLGHWVYPVHRLDRAASGAIAFGVDREAARDLQAALREARKDYRLVCRGETPAAFVSDRPLSDKPARTEFERLAMVRGFSVLRARLRTGRRHQIRRHLAHLGHHIVGDTRYGKGGINRWLRDEFGLPRLFLGMSMTEVYAARDVTHAYLLKHKLEDAGIEVMIMNESLQGALGEIPMGLATSPRILVDEEDAEKAVALLREVDGKL
jgi:tRNA pseudouridine65 synthase